MITVPFAVNVIDRFPIAVLHCSYFSSDANSLVFVQCLQCLHKNKWGSSCSLDLLFFVLSFHKNGVKNRVVQNGASNQEVFCSNTTLVYKIHFLEAEFWHYLVEVKGRENRIEVT